MFLGASDSDVKSVGDFLAMFSGLSLRNVLIGLAILVIGLIAVRLLVKAFGKNVGRAKGIPANVRSVMQTAVRVALDIVVILTATGTMGIPINSFVTVLSVIVLAVTLAIQNILNNVVGGFIIITSQPFSVGEFVQMEDIVGTVEEIRIMYTRFLTPDGRIVYVPNKNIYTANLVNYNRFGRRRAEITVSASYDASPDSVRAAVMEAVGETPGILADPAPIVHLESYGDSAIVYTVYFWCASGDFWSTKYAFNERLYSAFRKNGVEMTYPHLNVHIG